MADAPAHRFLLVAQLPPPVHGVTVMTQQIRDVVATGSGWTIEHRWVGGSASLQDINRRSIRKYVQFATLLLGLLVRRATGPRAEVSYITLAPWTHTALRDALLAGVAKGVSARTLVHLHGEGLDRLLRGGSFKARLSRRLLTGTELIACTSAAAEIAESSGLFARIMMLANSAPDPAPASNPVKSHKLRVGYLANLDPRKGVLRFVDALAAAYAAGVPFEAVIAGPSTPFLSRDDVSAHIDRLGLAGLVTVEESRYGSEKDEFLRGIDVLLYPSLHDHAPLVVIEALSYGAVPIVMDTGGLREILGTALSQNVYDPRENPETFETFVSRTLQHYATDRGRLEADRVTARTRYLGNYTEAHFVRRCRAILDAPPIRKTHSATLGHPVS